MNQSATSDSRNSLDEMWLLPQNPAMQGKQTAPVHLHRIDPERNMHRFYLLTVQPTLFGGVSVIRNWGRIGSSGRPWSRRLKRKMMLPLPCCVSSGETAQGLPEPSL